MLREIMSIFKTKGFDTLISKDTVITGTMVLNGTTVIDGHFDGESIHSDQNSKKDVLVVNGAVDVKSVIISHDLTITGKVTAKKVRVEGTLAIKSGSILSAERILYRNLVAEPGAVILGMLAHLDHVSDGEIV
jgi:cytoskeletal protein CcmA (bactofilin family)